MSYRIPKTLDNPIRCVGIPIDTLMVFMVIWSALFLFDQPIWGMVAGVIGANVFSRYRSRSITRRLVRFIYWYLPCEVNFIRGVQGHQRKMNMELKKWK
ncbi:hypothetical protein NF27_IP00170 [Candidatus Jidaibacter acanthamoeba]|uniref:Type IV conjugative transfer system protein TraL n=1 Tax=Candidatus Jidaibacter acanthamoebae TaxID=86105 RepID=A0A0C1QFB4_9RICK|nr:type IV conjugative transfer system protein TraL [Candidatus Jidaibacter acanthamoeba]KIE04249.1 hypothetical protein NF27_IP00170 [Candidatus Jidaibacter acanthamoeba]